MHEMMCQHAGDIWPNMVSEGATQQRNQLQKQFDKLNQMSAMSIYSDQRHSVSYSVLNEEKVIFYQHELGYLLSEVTLVTDFIYAEANWEATER